MLEISTVIYIKLAFSVDYSFQHSSMSVDQIPQLPTVVHLFQVCVDCHNLYYNDPWNNHKVDCSQDGRSRKTSFNDHAYFHVGQVGNNSALLRSELYSYNLQQRTFSHTLGSRLLGHVAGLPVGVRVISKGCSYYFVPFCPTFTE